MPPRFGVSVNRHARRAATPDGRERRQQLSQAIVCLIAGTVLFALYRFARIRLGVDVASCVTGCIDYLSSQTVPRSWLM